MNKQEQDLNGAIERLARNSGLKLVLKHFGGYIHLYHNVNGDATDTAFGNGNSKSELYWQVQLANKIIEAMRDKNEDALLRNYSKGFTTND